MRRSCWRSRGLPVNERPNLGHRHPATPHRIRRVGLWQRHPRLQGESAVLHVPSRGGHELGVEIAAVGPNERGLAVGDRCAVEPYLHCGAASLAAGEDELLRRPAGAGSSRRRRDARVHDRAVAKLHRSRSLSLDQLALVEMLTIGAHACGARSSSRGKTSWSSAPAPSAVHHRVRTTGWSAGERPRDQRLATRVLPAAPESGSLPGRTGGHRKAAQELLSGDLPTTVFDATGSAKSMMQAVQYVANGGKLVYVSLVQADLTFTDRSCIAGN